MKICSEERDSAIVLEPRLVVSVDDISSLSWGGLTVQPFIQASDRQRCFKPFRLIFFLVLAVKKQEIRRIYKLLLAEKTRQGNRRQRDDELLGYLALPRFLGLHCSSVER